MRELSDRGVRGLFVLLGLTLLLLVLQTGRTPLFEPDEGRYAEIPREMLATGDFVTPRLNGVLYFEKPPLYYWLVAGSMALLGPSEWAVRLPGMLASAGMVLLTAAFARRRWGLRTGLLAGIVTGTSGLVFILARIAIIDPVLSLALSAAAFAFCFLPRGRAARRRPCVALGPLRPGRRVRGRRHAEGADRDRPPGRSDRGLRRALGAPAASSRSSFRRGRSSSSFSCRSRGTSTWRTGIPTSSGSTSSTSTSIVS